jgi:hypothetical protein
VHQSSHAIIIPPCGIRAAVQQKGHYASLILEYRTLQGGLTVRIDHLLISTSGQQQPDQFLFLFQ